MTQIPGPAAGPTAAPASGLDRFFDWLRSIDLRRDGEEKWLAGVCSGIATRLGVDPIVIRAALVLLVLMGGIGVTVYLVAWAFIANDREEIVAERAIRHGDVLGIILLVVIGLSLIGGPGIAGNDNGFVWFWWVAIPVAVVVWLVTRHRDKPGRAATSGYAAGPAPAAYAPAPGEPPTGDATAATTAPGGSIAGPAPVAYAAPAATTTTGHAGAWAGERAAGHPAGPPQGPVPPTPIAPRPPKAPRPPRRRSAGFVGALLVGGLALAVYGTTLWLHDANSWPGSDETVALAAALAVFGVALVGLGIAGFRAGLTALVAILLAFSTWTASVVPNLSLGGGIGDRVWRPASTDTNPRYRLGIGSAELDLSRATNDPASPARVDAGIGIGELRIRIPKDLTVEVRSEVGAGDISRIDSSAGIGSFDPSSDVFDQGGSSDGEGRNVSTTQTFGSGTPDVVVDAHVGLGQILIGKE